MSELTHWSDIPEPLSRDASGEVPLMIRVWREKPLKDRFAQAERSYTIPREHPALGGMIEPLHITAWRYGLDPEALRKYIEWQAIHPTT